LITSKRMSWSVANPSTSRSTRLVAFSTVELAVTTVEKIDDRTVLKPDQIDGCTMMMTLVRDEERDCYSSII
jgi:hypothetical protein